MTLPEHAELFARIVEDPFDEQPWAVLEDWLLERDDPRAQLVRLEKAGKRTNAVIAQLFPALAGLDATWRAGFVTALRIDRGDLDLMSPPFRFLREIDLLAAERSHVMRILARLAKSPPRIVRVQGELVPPLAELELPDAYELLLAAFELEDAIGGVVTGAYSQVEGLVKALDETGVNVRRGFLPLVEDLIDAVLERQEIELHGAAIEVATMAVSYARGGEPTRDAMAHGLRTVIESLLDEHHGCSSPWASDVIYRIELSRLRPRSRPLPARSPTGPRPSRPSRPTGSR